MLYTPTLPAAPASVRLPIGVYAIECVATRAMRHPRMAGRGRIATEHVDPSRNDLKVRRIHTMPETAQVIDGECRRDRLAVT